MEQPTGSKLGKECPFPKGHIPQVYIVPNIPQVYIPRCILSPCLFNLYADYVMLNAGLDEAQSESRLLGEISITSDMQMTPPLLKKEKRN